MVRVSTAKPATAAERAAKWREKIKADPIKHDEYLLKEKMRYRKRVDSKKLPIISQLSERGQRKQRKQWRDRKRSSRNKLGTRSSADSAPSSSSDHLITDSSRKAKAGRKKVRKDRAKAYRTIKN